MSCARGLVERIQRLCGRARPDWDFFADCSEDVVTLRPWSLDAWPGLYIGQVIHIGFEAGAAKQGVLD